MIVKPCIPRIDLHPPGGMAPFESFFMCDDRYKTKE